MKGRGPVWIKNGEIAIVKVKRGGKTGSSNSKTVGGRKSRLASRIGRALSANAMARGQRIK